MSATLTSPEAQAPGYWKSLSASRRTMIIWLGGLLVLAVILLVTKYARGFVANISVLLGIVAGCIVAASLGKMSFAKVAKAHWF
ncbi:MAG: solute carrier family 23 protein, partial [Ilumatobacteraceae bacterium]